MERIHLVWRAYSDGGGTWPNGNHEEIRRMGGWFDARVEVVAGARGTASDLFLRALRLCQYHCARDGDVYTISNCRLGGRNSAVSCSAFTGLFLQSGGFLDSLRHDARPHLLRCWVHYSANMVVDRTAYFVSDHRSLEYRRFHVVEVAGTLVTPAAGRKIDICELEKSPRPNSVLR